MRSIFKQNIPYKSIDKIIIKNIITELEKLLGYVPDEQWVMDTLCIWSNVVDACTDPSVKTNKSEIDSELIRLNYAIKCLRSGINVLEKTKTNSFSYPSPLNIENINIDNIIIGIEEQIHSINIKIIYLKFIEKIKYKIKERISLGLLQVIAAGMAIGLKSTGNKYAGRGYTNDLYKFVSIITGIEDNERIARHYKSCQKLLNEPVTDPIFDPS